MYKSMECFHMDQPSKFVGAFYLPPLTSDDRIIFSHNLFIT